MHSAFETNDNNNINEIGSARKYQPNGPLVNAEYYPGWFTHWHDPSPGSADTNRVAETLR